MANNAFFSLAAPIARGASHKVNNASLSSALTVEAWINSDAAPAETTQALVSIWKPREKFEGFSAYDVGHTDGLISQGYFGACFDGRYVYFSPEHTEDLATHAVVLRYDTHGDFKDPRSYAAYDAKHTGGLDTRGYYGAGFDGRYVYFVPRQHDMAEYHTYILRLDTRGDFKSPASWDAFDIGPKHSSQSCAFDGRYLYLMPGYEGPVRTEANLSPNVIRYDTTAPFKDRKSYEQVDISTFLGKTAVCFDGAAFDGRYVFLSPLSGDPVRFDTQGKFADAKSWSRIDGKQVGVGMTVGVVFDGKWVYYCAYAHGVVSRVDVTKPFDDPKSWQWRDVDLTEGHRTAGFDGGFFDGRYVTFVPFVYGGGKYGENYTLHGNHVRYDTLAPFESETSWQAFDAYVTEGLRTVGQNGGAFDGRYFYAAPWRSLVGRKAGQIGVNGRVLRYDSTGNDATFSLRACDLGHNGGLGAALRGPAFLINTTSGPRSVAANKLLSPGKHHVVGSYDGAQLKLFIDGQLVNSCAASGKLQGNAVPVTVGALPGGSAPFPGTVEKVEIRAEAR